jgi:broad specificity phosphatase PhoE
MQELGQVDVIISSPFRRCLQTSAALVRELNMTAGSWLIDWQLSEVGRIAAAKGLESSCQQLGNGGFTI